METVVERLVMSKQQFKFHSQAFEVAVFETIKFRYQPNKFHVNGRNFLIFLFSIWIVQLPEDYFPNHGVGNLDLHQMDAVIPDMLILLNLLEFGCLIEHQGFRLQNIKWKEAILEQNSKVIDMCTWRFGTYRPFTNSVLKLLCFIFYSAVESRDAQSNIQIRFELTLGLTRDQRIYSDNNLQRVETKSKAMFSIVNSI